MPPLGRFALVACLLFAPLSPAQDGGGELDDGGDPIDIPDASVGSGGADRDSPEQEDRTGRYAAVCVNGGECNPGFACVQGKCQYSGVREAEGGCLLGVQAALFFGGFGFMVRRSGRRSRRG